MNRLHSLNSTFLVVLASLTLSGCSGCGGGGTAGSAGGVGPLPPIASFVASPISGNGPLRVQFTNTSFLGTEGFRTFNWVFGDGDSSNQESPAHTYQLPGVYTVTLFVTTSTGSDLERKIDLIEVLPAGLPPRPDFTATPRQGEAQLAVQFSNLTDLAGAGFAEYAWDFGDGSIGTEENPSHVYVDAGTYTVSLTATTAGGTATETKTDYIEVLPFVPPPIAAFSADPTSGQVPLEVQFTNLSDLQGAESAEYFWEFGDGGTSTEQNPSRIYTEGGIFMVSLTVLTRGGTDIATDQIEVLLEPPPIADFSITPPVGKLGSQVQFTDLSDLQGAESAFYFWDFGDGKKATEKDPVHTYTKPGKFTVSMTLVSRGGVDQAIQEYFVFSFPAGPPKYIVVFEQTLAEEPVSLTLMVSSPNTNFRVSIPGLGFDETFPMTFERIVGIPIPLSALVSGSDVIRPLGIEITSDSLFSVYGLNQQNFITDAFAAYPVDALGTEHYVMSYNTFDRDVPGLPLAPGQFAVVAVEDNTAVTIVPTVNTGTRVAGTPYQIRLDRLQVYQLQTDNRFEDLTGTHILSDKPVALFSGNACADVPDSDTPACDHLTEQIPPVNTWGTEIITVPLASRLGGDTFRILAARDGTTVNIAGPQPETFSLDNGEFAQRLLEGINVITSDKPILVAQYANGLKFDNVIGDPFMMIVMPAERFLTNYIFPIPGLGFGSIFAVNVVAPTADILGGQVLLDGTPLAPELFEEVSGTPFSAAQVPVGIGSHTLLGPNPLGAYIYGFGDFSSYGFPGGMAF